MVYGKNSDVDYWSMETLIQKLYGQCWDQSHI